MIEELYGNYEFQSALDVGGLLSSETKMFFFFKFVYAELEENHKILKDENISMLPCVYYENNYDKYIVLEYNFLVQSMGRFIDKYSLGDAEMFLDLFSAVPYDKKPNGTQIM
ncbi:hypothetical protein SMGD1_0688 [Sulfurimonas gotlandica GD1]|uniref:Uncharacterized protein n=1 Tax=Sulfurimonas gotlandica (strain DSM 19862 / JCM 16533 / GD1) TaxID=929558 RepID=B6BP06_SULGG|nr:hypothetical protein [Sulfurimonas gotlandica]EDZ61165.1 hypothetical protein CBGD1_1522 [Sulfurimonas gotlandica GD1]EHP29215.1 hypothetical protein SMGD1_0688 [Sulfurimonas gotlandica GD1]